PRPPLSQSFPYTTLFRSTVLLEAGRRLGILRFVGRDEQVERLMRFGARRGHPDLVQLLFRVGLHMFGHLVQHVGGLVHPAALLASTRPDLTQRRPEPQRAIRDRKLRLNLQSTLPHIQQQLLPRLFALAITILHRDQFLPAVSRRAHQTKQALTIAGGIFKANVEVNAIGPDVNVMLVGQIAFGPLLVFDLPLFGESRDAAGRQSRAVVAEQRRQCVAEVAGADTRQIETGQQFLDAFALAQIRRHKTRDEAFTLAFGPAVMHTRHANVQRTDPRDDRSRLSVIVAHDLSPTGGIDTGGVLIDPRRDLGLDRLHEHPPGALAENVGKRIPRRGGGGWQRERLSGNVFHGGVLLPNVGSWGCEIHPRYAAFFIPSSTGFGYSSAQW